MALSFCGLASGSKGNSFYITDGETELLLDLGICASRAEKCLAVLGAKCPDVIITHTHSDHVAGLSTYLKHFESPRVYCSSRSAFILRRTVGDRLVTFDGDFNIGTLKISPFTVSHDVPCVGYTVSGGGKKLGYATDIGVMTDDIISRLSTCDFVILESNHDADMLACNPAYPPILKKRISSDFGHLSNSAAALTAVELARRGVRHFLLAHLSESNNYPELACSNVVNALDSKGFSGVEVEVALQDKMTAFYSIT